MPKEFGEIFRIRQVRNATPKHTFFFQKNSKSISLSYLIFAGDFQVANIRTVSRLNQSLFNSTAFLNVILAESKSSIETRWLDAQNAMSHRNKTFISWKRLSQNVTNVTEAFFSRLLRSGSCVSCRNEELLVASVDFEGGTVIPNISIANPASEFWNNSAVASSFNMLQSTYANMSLSFGNFPL
jgi:hypothetical protein